MKPPSDDDINLLVRSKEWMEMGIMGEWDYYWYLLWIMPSLLTSQKVAKTPKNIERNKPSDAQWRKQTHPNRSRKLQVALEKHHGNSATINMELLEPDYCT